MSQSRSLPTVNEVFDLLRRRANHAQHDSDIECGGANLIPPPRASHKSFPRGLSNKMWLAIIVGICLCVGWLWWSSGRNLNSGSPTESVPKPFYPDSTLVQGQEYPREEGKDTEPAQESNQNVKNEIKDFLHARKTEGNTKRNE